MLNTSEALTNRRRDRNGGRWSWVYAPCAWSVGGDRLWGGTGRFWRWPVRLRPPRVGRVRGQRR